MDRKRTVNINISVTAVISIVLIIAIVVAAATYMNSNAEAESQLTVTEIKHAFEDESDIVTQSDNIDLTVTYRAVKKLGIELPLTENKERISCKGKVKGGYDLSKIKIKKDEEQKIIKLKMPKMKIIAKEINKSSIKHESIKRALFHWKDMDYTIKLMDKLEKQLVKEARKSDDFENKALENAEKTLGKLIKNVPGGDSYKVVCI